MVAARLTIGGRERVIESRHSTALFERRQIISRLERALVELDMLAAVHHLLGNEGLDLALELGRRALAELTHAVDEERPRPWENWRDRAL
jgi:hypothetical protein